jgi:hypothetical protein
MPRPKKSPAARAEQPSRAEMIRQTAQALGKRVRPRDIIAALKEKGVTVSHTLVKPCTRPGFAASADAERLAPVPVHVQPRAPVAR